MPVFCSSQPHRPFTAPTVRRCPSPLEAVYRQFAALKEGELGALEHLSKMVALLLAVAAALISNDTEARREITDFFTQALRCELLPVWWTRS
jgi:hypothetical protein